MRTKIIIITGKAQSGKDTAANHIRNILKINGRSSSIYPFAEELKQICHNMFGLSHIQCWGENKDKNTTVDFKWSDLPLNSNDLAKLMLNSSLKKTSDQLTAREVMQIWGTEIFRKFDPNCWVRSTINKIKKDSLDFAIISDARFPNEIDFAKEYDPIIIRLTRDVLEDKHQSEISLDDYNFDTLKDSYIINNTMISLDQKNEKIEKIIKKYL
jgi:hypothetical protein